MSYHVYRPTEVLPADYRGPVSVDTETSGLFADDGARTSVVSLAYLDDGDQIIDYAFPFDQGPRDKLAVVQESLFEAADDVNLPLEEWDHLLEWLADPRRWLVFHNAPFDLEKLRVGTRHWPGRELEHQYYWDTRLACAELWPTEPTSLKPTAVRLWGEGEDDAQGEVKLWLKRNKLTMGDADKVPWDIIGPYAAKDAEQTLRLFLHQSDLLDEGWGDRAAVWREFEVGRILYRITRRGLGYNAAGSLDVADQLEAKAAEIAAQLPFEPQINAAKRYFFEQQGLDRYAKETDAGGLSMTDEVLFNMERDGIPWAAEYRLHSKYSRAVSMWYRGYANATGADGRLRTYFRQAHVRSGRFSVERVNLQAIPKGDKDFAGIPGVRSFVEATGGHELWNLDLSQAELRVATKYADCEKMAQLLAEGADLHGVTCQEVMGVDPSAPDWKTQRDIAKRLTFGGIFQVGGKTFRDTLLQLAHMDLPLHQCNAIVRGWRDLYPEFGYAYRQAERQVQRHGYVTVLRDTEYEKRSWFGPRDWPNTGWSRIVQGSLAEAMKLWILQAEDYLFTELGRESLVLTVHDSLVLELPKGEAEQIANEVARRGEKLITDLFDTTIKVDVSPWRS